MITDYHASYYAHELSRVGGTAVDRLDRALFDACVNLNPRLTSVVQIKKLRAEIDTKTKKGIIGRVLEWFPVSRNRKDSLVDLLGLVPYWLPHEWRAV